jgi:transcriptional regulator with XRE-family HTH domain
MNKDGRRWQRRGVSAGMGAADDDVLATLAARLDDLRVQRDLQVGGLLQRTGLGRTTISKALNGREVPSKETVLKLARALKADAGPLLELRQKACDRMQPSISRAAVRQPGKPAGFLKRYLDYVVQRNSHLTVVGLDLSRPDRARWPLDAAYLSLELAEDRPHEDGSDTSSPYRTVVCRAERALASRRRMLVRGLAGSGKTTLLQWLAISTAKGKLPSELDAWRGLIPFVLPMRTLVRNGTLPSPELFLASVGAPMAGAQPPGWADELLAAGRALVLVDGVDEVREADRQEAKQWLEQLLHAYPQSAFVVTTRPSAVPEGWLAPFGFSELSVRPMGTADTSLFVQRWHTAARHGVTADEQAQLKDLEDSLLVTMRAERDVAQLSTTPLLCALLCALHRDRRGHLPHSRMELYEAALAMLMVRRDRERSISSGIELSGHQVQHLLQQLAYWLIRNQQSEMAYTRAVHLIEDLLPAMPAVADQGDAEATLQHLLERSGLLRQPTAQGIDFVHRTFQDYLGAKAAVEAHDFPLLINHAHDSQWEDVVRMAIAHARPIERAELLEQLVERGDAEKKHRSRLHLLAAASLQYTTEVSPTARAMVTQRASALMPPLSLNEARALAALGPVVLDLLPRSAEGLDRQAADALVYCAGAVGGDQAYAYLQRFVPTRPASEREFGLVDVWESFDAVNFVHDFLLPQGGGEKLLITVENRAQMAALGALAPFRRIAFRLPVTEDDLTPHLSPEHTEGLQLWEGRNLRSLAFARGLHRLEFLTLRDCTHIASLEEIAGLPLTHLGLMDVPAPHDFSWESLSCLPHLNALHLYTSLPWPSLQTAPLPAGIQVLWLGAQVNLSIEGLARWKDLRELTVNHALQAQELEELADLPHLTKLHARALDFHCAPRYPSVTSLSLSPDDGDLVLDRLPDRFPNLERLTLSCQSRWNPDLSPLLALKGLKLHIGHPAHVTGIDRFPADRLQVTGDRRIVS